MNKRLNAYLYSVIIAAALVLPFQNWHALTELGSRHLAGAATLIVLGLLSEVLAVSAVVGTHKASASVAFLPYFAAALLFGPAAAVAVVVLTALPTQLLIHRKPVLRSVFNAAQWTLSMAVATGVYGSLGGVPFYQGGQLLTLNNLLLLGTFAVAFFVLNQLFVSIAIALSTGNRFSTVLSRLVAPTGAHLLYDVLVSPVALIIAVLYTSSWIPGLVMVSFPLLIIRQSVQSSMRLQQANKDLLSVLVKTIETRDPYTSGHSIRVSILAKAIAEDLDLPATTVDKIEMAALVHDIGKVDAVYASIIRKEGSLSADERRVIVTHAAKGAEFLETLSSFTQDVIRGVKYHHERFDGTGYPDGLVGDGIPLAGRIIQLCDSIDAMLSDRPYRKALTVEYVRGELLRCAGTQFDPRIVDVILKRNTLERAAALVRPDGGPLQHRIAASA